MVDIKCPHCKRGELVNKYFNVQLQADFYTCNVCSRGWHQDKKGRWHSHFAADVEVYSKNGHTLIDNSTWHINEEKK